MRPFQIDWLAQDLQAANSNRSSVPWLITMGHRPIYCSNHNHQDCNSTFSKYLQHKEEDLLYNNKVDLHFQSHVHGYERTWPMYRDQPVQTSYDSPAAPVYIVNGAGGNREGNSQPPGGLPWCPPASGRNRPQSSAVGFGYMVLEGGTLRYQQYVGNVTGPATLLDDWQINKKV